MGGIFGWGPRWGKGACGGRLCKGGERVPKAATGLWALCARVCGCVCVCVVCVFGIEGGGVELDARERVCCLLIFNVSH